MLIYVLGVVILTALAVTIRQNVSLRKEEEYLRERWHETTRMRGIAEEGQTVAEGKLKVAAQALEALQERTECLQERVSALTEDHAMAAAERDQWLRATNDSFVELEALQAKSEALRGQYLRLGAVVNHLMFGTGMKDFTQDKRKRGKEQTVSIKEGSKLDRLINAVVAKSPVETDA